MKEPHNLQTSHPAFTAGVPRLPAGRVPEVKDGSFSMRSLAARPHLDRAPRQLGQNSGTSRQSDANRKSGVL